MRPEIVTGTALPPFAGIRMPEGVHMPQELLPAASLSFQGLRSTWRRDGFGAELVAVTVDDPVTAVSDDAEDADGSARSRRRPTA